MTLEYFLFIFGNVFQFTLLLLTFWQGESEERIAGVALLLNILAIKLSLTNHWAKPEYFVFAADVMLLAVLAALAMKTPRWWLLWCSAFQLLIAVTHLAIIVDPSVVGETYRASMIILGYLVLFALAAGTWGAFQRRRRLRSGAVFDRPR